MAHGEVEIEKVVAGRTEWIVYMERHNIFNVKTFIRLSVDEVDFDKQTILIRNHAHVGNPLAEESIIIEKRSLRTGDLIDRQQELWGFD